MMRTIFLFLLCPLSLLISCEGRSDKKPNIVLIMADDLGYGDLACYGNREIRTPHLDALAAGGMRFTDFHSNGSVCTPTRAAIMSGQYPQRTGLEGVIYVKEETRQYGMDPSVLTLAEVLKEGAYTTGILGKWHLGYDSAFNPVCQGFDEFIGYRSGNVDYHSHYDNGGIYDWYKGTDSLYEEGYVTDLITAHAESFIERNRDRPFFLYIPHEAPHVPFQGRSDPAYRLPGKAFTYFGPVVDTERAYKEMIEVMDEGIGRVMTVLADNDLLENTLVFFLSDNGGLSGTGNNGRLRGAKSSLFEGGHRVPAIASWKGKIAPSVSREFLMSFDLYPTIVEMCGVKMPRSLRTDGKDFSKHLLQGEKLPERTLCWRYREQKAVRTGGMKLLIDGADTLMFDLSADPGEKADIYPEYPLLRIRLLDKLAAWEEEMSSYEIICP